MRWEGEERIRYGGEKRRIQGLVGKIEGKTPLGRPRRATEEYIKMDLEEVEWERMGLIDLVLDSDRWGALVKALLNFRVP